MRGIESLDWHNGRMVNPGLVSSARPVAGLLAKGRQAVVHTAQKISHYLMGVEAAHAAHRRLFLHQTADKRNRAGSLRVPARVWRRRSALLTMLQEQCRDSLPAAQVRQSVPPITLVSCEAESETYLY